MFPAHIALPLPVSQFILLSLSLAPTSSNVVHLMSQSSPPPPACSHFHLSSLSPKSASTAIVFMPDTHAVLINIRSHLLNTSCHCESVSQSTPHSHTLSNIYTNRMLQLQHMHECAEKKKVLEHRKSLQRNSLFTPSHPSPPFSPLSSSHLSFDFLFPSGWRPDTVSERRAMGQVRGRGGE